MQHDSTSASSRPCPACGQPVPGPQRGIEYRSCPACETVSTATVPTEAELAAYYNTDYAVPEAPLSPERRARWADSVAAAEVYVAPGRALEIGASHGHLLRLLAERGWQPAGVELSDRARAGHAARSPAIPSYPDLEAARAAGWTALDLVVALHTIEHVPSPDAFLDTLHEFLRPGGVLLLTTPNGGSIVRWVTGSHWQWRVAPAHLELFTPAGLAIALGHAGFDVLAMQSRRGDAPNSTASHVLLSPLRAIKRRLPRPAQQVVAGHAPGQGIAQRLDVIVDPPTRWLRERAYRALLGPELVVIARSRRAED